MPAAPPMKISSPREAALGDTENDKDRYSRNCCREKHWNVGKQRNADCRTKELRQVSGHCRDLLRYPKRIAYPWSESGAAHLGEIHPCCDAELCRKTLNKHGHQVGHQDDPQQGVAELCPALDVGSKVARVYICNRSDECWADERQYSEQSSSSAFYCFPRRALQLGVRSFEYPQILNLPYANPYPFLEVFSVLDTSTQQATPSPIGSSSPGASSTRMTPLPESVVFT